MFSHYRSPENTAYDMTYNSINYMYNSMRWPNTDKLIRGDGNFEEITKKVTVPENNTVFYLIRAQGVLPRSDLIS